MGYGRRIRIGLMVPSSNTTMEPEFNRMAPQDVSVHSARMRLDEVTPEGLVRMADESERAAGLLATAGVGLIVYGCTTGSLVGGAGWEEHLTGCIEEETGIKTTSTARAVVEAIKALGGGRIAVATPYTEELNDLERDFLASHGVEVAAMRGLGLTDNLEIGRTEGAVVEELVRSLYKGADAVFISCTNLPTIDLIERLEEETGLPVATSNQASMWAVLKDSGIEGIDGYGVLLRDHLQKEVNGPGLSSSSA